MSGLHVQTMSEKTAQQHKKKGIGYEEVKQDGQVKVEEGVVMLRRANGEDITINGTVEVHVNDVIFWTADCKYTQRNS
jgi:hypothetical protein